MNIVRPAIAVCIVGGTLFLCAFYKGGRGAGNSRPLNDQLVSFLQEYITINTSHPNPAYDKAITFLKKHADKDGFITNVVPLASGNKMLIITMQGSDLSLPALALNHHMDVVPATPEKWVKDPFAGDIYGGAIVGRGTQDMKGIGATHYFALKECKQKGLVLRRTVHIFAVPEEEVGGFKGTKEFVCTDEFKKLNVGYLIDEGHASGDDTTLDIKVAERKPIQMRVTTQGELAHGSHLDCQNAIHDLVSFLESLRILHQEQQAQLCTKQAGELLSCNITSLTAGIRKKDGSTALNMVPDSAQATVDVRVPPTMKKREVLKKIEDIMKPFKAMQYTIIAQADEEPILGDYKTPFYKALSRSIEKCGLKARPHYFEASSDLRFYQVLGIQGVGLTPFTIKDNIHGINESVPINQLIRGKDITLQFLIDFCT